MRTGTAGEAGSVAGAGDAGRDPLLDNARFLLLLLVVAGHAMAPLRSDLPGVEAGYVWLYAFHMPLFVLLSGFTSRSYRGEPRQVRRTVATLVWPLLLVSTLLELQRDLQRDRPLLEGFSPLSTPWLTWFVAALLLWRLTTPVWQQVRWPLAVGVAVSLASGLFRVPEVLGLPQVLALLPFWLLGLRVARRHHADALARPAVRVAAAGVLVGFLALCWYRAAGWSNDWWYWRDHYGSTALDVGQLEGMAVRLGLLVVALVLGLAFLALVPRRRHWWTAWGERTLYAYLLHGFLVRLAVHQGWVDAAGERGLMGAAGAVLVAFAVATVLMSPVVGRALRPVLEPRLRWLLPDPPAADRRPAR